MRNRPKVSIVRGKDVESVVKKAVDLVADLRAIVHPEDTVLIKPNMAAPRPLGTGVNTSPSVIKTLMDMIHEIGGKPIVGDGTGAIAKYDTKKIFEIIGLKDLVELSGARLVDLNLDEPVQVEVPGGRALKKLSIARTVLEADVIINVPVLKTHLNTVVSLCMKNLMGCIVGEEKTQLFHSWTWHTKPVVKRGIPGVEWSLNIPSQEIVDLNKIIKPTLCVVDGTIAMEGPGPIYGDPVQMDTVIAGKNPVAVDAVAAVVMGFDPKRIDKLSLAAIEGLGEIDLNNIEVVGESIENVSRRFYFPSSIYAPYTWLLNR